MIDANSMASPNPIESSSINELNPTTIVRTIIAMIMWRISADFMVGEWEEFYIKIIMVFYGGKSYQRRRVRGEGFWGY